MNTYTPYEIARMIDISAVRADSTLDEVQKVADAAKKYAKEAASATGFKKNEIYRELL